VTQTLITHFITYTILLHNKIKIEMYKKEQQLGRAEHYREDRPMNLKSLMSI
jgi:hypothetical protein